MPSQRIPWSTRKHPAWRSLDQLGLLWGLNRAKTIAVIKALVGDGRMEVRQMQDVAEPLPEYRIVFA